MVLKELFKMYHHKIIHRNKAKNFFQQFHDKLENFLFWIIQNLPENLIPAALINWSDQYLDKRIQHLKQEILHQNWNKAHLDQALKEIRSRQHIKEKALSGK